MTRKAFILITLLVVAAAGFWIFNPAKSQHIESVKPVREKAVQAVYATGTVEASLMIPISPKVGARLMTLNVDEGSHVEAGQILAQLEDADLLQAAADMQAKMELAQKDLSRAEKLSKSGAVSKEGFDSAQATFKSATASFERAKAELGYLQLIAPQAGTVIRRDGEIGELIPVGTAVFWMNGGDQIRIETEVDEEDIGLVQPGQKVLVSADAFPNQTFNGTVQSITPKGDPVARSYRVRVSLEEDAPMMIGMTAETNIITQVKENALMIPATSVKGDYLYVIQGHKPVLTKIKKGIVADKKVEVIEGVSENDAIALRYTDIAVDEDDKKKAVCNMGTGC